MKYHLISKKTIRNKDFAALTAEKPKAGYLKFRPAATSEINKHEVLFRTPRGWFMRFFVPVMGADGKTTAEKKIGEVSITTAQKWLDECNINYNLGW